MASESVPSTTTTFVEPLGNHTHTVIFLHGREDFGSDLAQYFFDSKDSDNKSLADLFPTIRWVFPTAKLRYCARREFEFGSFAEALKGEEILSQWFDVWNLEEPEEKSELMLPGLRESTTDIVEIINEEAELVPMSKIILGGISQGCATSIYSLLSSGLDLGGFIGLCSWLPFGKEFDNVSSRCAGNKKKISRQTKAILDIPTKEITCSNSNGSLDLDLSTLTLSPTLDIATPVFLAHSRDDETVPFAMGNSLRNTIQHLGFDITWKEYEDGGHWINSKHGVDDMAAFIGKIMVKDV